MHIRRIAFQGLRALPEFEATGFQRVVPVLGSPAGRTALADAITIALSPFSSADTAAAAATLGLGKNCDVTGGDFPEELLVSRPEMARALFGDDRTFKIKIDLVLDPPQYGEMRANALRDPRLVSALSASDTTLGVGVGWVFTQDWTMAATHVLGVRLGDVELPLVGDDRPAWLTKFFQGMSGRGHRQRPAVVDVDGYAMAERSADPGRREAARRVRETLTGRPFGLGDLQVVESGTTWLGLQRGGELLPLRSYGPSVEHLVGLAQAVHLSGAEILVAEAPLGLSERPRALARWLRAQSEADGSALEQVFLVGVGGEGALEPG
jgi:hypothetical protein